MHASLSSRVIPKKETELRAAFWDQVATFPDGFKIRNCIQCGSCTGSCPVAYAMDITPREIVALFRGGFLEDILRSRSIWICASCYACTVRCPQGIRVTDNLYALKRLATQKRIFPEGFPAQAMSSCFANNIRRFGRNWELWLGVRYFLTAKPSALLSFWLQKIALGMLKRGRLALLPKGIRGRNEVRAIIKRAQSMGGL